MVSKDDRYLPEETVKLTQELIAQDRPVALIAYRGTANTLALIKSDVLVKQGITLVGTLTGAKEVQGAAGVLTGADIAGLHVVRAAHRNESEEHEDHQFAERRVRDRARAALAKQAKPS